MKPKPPAIKYWHPGPEDLVFYQPKRKVIKNLIRLLIIINLVVWGIILAFYINHLI